jgi:hypothetical protein
MSNQLKLDESIVTIESRFHHALGLATCLALTKEKVQNKELLQRFFMFESLISIMRDMHLRLEALSEATDPKKTTVDAGSCNEILYALTILDESMWKLVEDLPPHPLHNKNKYEEAFGEGAHGLSNMLRKIKVDLQTCIRNSTEVDNAA